MRLNPRYALLSIQYNTVDGFSVQHFRCVLWHLNMCPKYCILQEEMSIKFINDHKISFYVFNNVRRCSNHGLSFDEKYITCAHKRQMGQRQQENAWYCWEIHLVFVLNIITYQWWIYMHTINPIFFSFLEKWNGKRQKYWSKLWRCWNI